MKENIKLTHSARRINILASKFKAKKYLEVGVNRGATFTGVNIQQKTAVDPKLRFDYASLQSEYVSFFEVSSDIYFTEYAKTEKFDIIFLDGLHTFEQTFRDLCNSLAHCHDRTIWLIDDTVPIDIYSAHKDQRKAVEFRRLAGGQSEVKSSAWHGDVYKTVFAIHDFFPSFSYCTINDNGNPQTLLWRMPRSNFKPLYDNFEQISRLSYFDYYENSCIFNFKSEEIGLGLPEFTTAD